MKRLCYLFIAGILIFTFSTPALATTWDLSTIDNGMWQEELLGAHGVPGNTLSAWALSGQWSLSDLSLDSVGFASDPLWQYESSYSGGTMVLDESGPWGFSVTIPVTAVNLSRRDNGNLDFLMTLTGQAGGYDWIVEATFFGVLETNYFDDGMFLHGSLISEAFETLTVTATAVPEPATMLLIGTGLIGLLGFRRKFRK